MQKFHSAFLSTSGEVWNYAPDLSKNSQNFPFYLYNPIRVRAHFQVPIMIWVIGFHVWSRTRRTSGTRQRAASARSPARQRAAGRPAVLRRRPRSGPLGLPHGVWRGADLRLQRLPPARAEHGAEGGDLTSRRVPGKAGTGTGFLFRTYLKTLLFLTSFLKPLQ